MVPVGHQLPGCEAQQPGCVGDQAGNGAGKQFIGGAVPKEGLLHSRRVGLKDKTFFCWFVCDVKQLKQKPQCSSISISSYPSRSGLSRSGLGLWLGQSTGLTTAEAKRVVNVHFSFIPFVWGFCRRASNILKWYCLLHVLLLQMHKRAVQLQQHQRRGNMHIHAWARLRNHNTVWGFSQVRTNVLLPDQHWQLWWEWTGFFSGPLAEYAENAADYGHVWRETSINCSNARMWRSDICTRGV